MILAAALTAAIASGSLVTIDDFSRWCARAVVGDAGPECLGYLFGVIDALEGQKTFCLPEKFDTRAVIGNVMINWPPQTGGQENAAPAIEAKLGLYYPCP